MIVLKWIRKINDAAVIAAISALTIIVILQVFSRYLFNNSLTWSEEISRYLQIWMVMLGAAVVMRHKEHLAIDILTASFPKKVKYCTDFFVFLVILVFFGLVVYHGITVAANAARQVSPAVGIKMSYIYAALPEGCRLVLLETLCLFVEHIKKGIDLFSGKEPPLPEPTDSGITEA